MGANKKHKILSVAGILSALKPGRSYQVSNLARAYGVRSDHIRRFLNEALEAGHVEKIYRQSHGEWMYRLPVPPEEQEQLVPRPWHDMKLNETLSGYNASLFSLAELNDRSR